MSRPSSLLEIIEFWRAMPLGKPPFIHPEDLPAMHCTSSEPIGQVGIGIKRGSGPSELKFWWQDDVAGVDLQWFSV